jgi:hypothetical protein
MTDATPSTVLLVRELLRQTCVVACGWMVLMLPLAAVVLTVGTLGDPAATYRHSPLVVGGLPALAGCDVVVAGWAAARWLRGWWRGAPGAGRRSLLGLLGVVAIWVPWVFLDVAAYGGGG